MSTLTDMVTTGAVPAVPVTDLPPLATGDHLDQPTFHARYEAMAAHIRAELIGGVVYMASPVSGGHADSHSHLGGCLLVYAGATPGTKSYNDPTLILSGDTEPQPDHCLVIRSEHGGATKMERGYIVGPPELVVEIASSTEAYDLHSKKAAYERAGVREYVVVALRQAKVLAFVSRDGRFETLASGADGILRSETFPGLWIDTRAALASETNQLLAVLQQGLATPEHAAFVKRLNPT